MAILTPEQTQDFARRRLGLQSEAEVAQRRLGEDYTINSQRLQQESQQAQRDVGDQLASQGLFNSGIRVNEQGQVVSRYNQSMADLEQGRSRGIEDIQRNLATGLAEVDYGQSAALAQANRAEQEANERRAQLEAIARAQAVHAPDTGGAYGGAQGQGTLQLPTFQPSGLPGGQYINWPQFRQANPQVANMLLWFSGGNEQDALRMATSDGYIVQMPAVPSPNSKLSRY